jgi:NHLM bacteriocin system ABC transporter ATP-binding protein
MNFSKINIEAISENIEAPSYSPIILTDSTKVIRVDSGHVDLFIAKVTDHSPVGRRVFVATFTAGAVIPHFSGNEAEEDRCFFIVGSPETHVSTYDFPKLLDLAKSNPDLKDYLCESLTKWQKTLVNGICDSIVPSSYSEYEGEVSFEEDDVLYYSKGVKAIKLQQGSLFLYDNQEMQITEGSSLLIGHKAWLKANKGAKVTVTTIEELIAKGGLLEVIKSYSSILSNTVQRFDDKKKIENESNWRTDKNKTKHEWNNSIQEIATLTNPLAKKQISNKSDQDPTFAALTKIGEVLGLDIKLHPDMEKGGYVDDPLEAVLQASSLKSRKVKLDNFWYNKDGGPLLAYTKESGTAIALLKKSSSKYEAWDPQTGETVLVTQEYAKNLRDNAYTLYRSFPNKTLNLIDILRFSTFGSTKELVWLIVLSVSVGLLGMLPPYMTKMIFDDIIPSSDRSQLLTLFYILIVSLISTALFNLSRNFVQLRLETKADATLQAAIWDRLLSLPVPFFRKYAVGDLSERVMGIQHIRAALAGSTLSTMLSSLTAIMQVFLVIEYGGALAPWAFGLIFIALLVMIISSRVTMHFERIKMEVQGKSSSLIFQLISGINKIKITGTERKAYVRWSTMFAEQRRLSIKSEIIDNYFSIFHGSFPAICSMIIFYKAFHLTGASSTGAMAMSTGTFLAFNAAFSTLMNAILGLGESILSIVNIVPLWERSKPILEEKPEIDDAKKMPPKLSGSIGVSGIDFRYEPEGHLILKDVSLEINPGEFVAIVGPSGSGKSTLLRLLLGFETPESGSIFYDGMDLASINLRLVRQQIGTVLQNGKLLQGDIFTNIVGSSPLGIDEAWQAAEMAGFAEDIKSMPMGMHTVLNEGATTLSGGQRQRLLISRALVKNPNVIYFDEATSALDNRTQAIVSESLNQLNATRVVIAHRLSTIKDADKIIVLKDGVLVEQGSFSELIEQNGIFADMSSRQIV